MTKTKFTAYLIEDLPEARDNLIQILTEVLPEIQIIGEADNIISAAKLLANRQPDILFLDIELGNHTAFDLLDMVPNLSAKIIFTTASDEYAIKAFRYSAMDYLLKPIDPDELVSAIEKIVLTKSNIQTSQIDILKEVRKIQDESKSDSLIPDNALSRIALHTMEKIQIVELVDVVRCEADGNYSKFYIRDKTPILVTRTLKEYDKLLADQGFLRVHQSHLVNTKHIDAYIKVDGGYLQMKDGSKVAVSVRKKSSVMAALDELN